MDSLKHLIEREVLAMVKDMRAAAPAEKVALARAIAALASALPEFGANSNDGGLRGILETLQKNTD